MLVVAIMLMHTFGAVTAQSKFTYSTAPNKVQAVIRVWQVDWDKSDLGLSEPSRYNSSDTLMLWPGEYILEYVIEDTVFHDERVHVPHDPITFHKILFLDRPSLADVQFTGKGVFRRNWYKRKWLKPARFRTIWMPMEF